MSTLEEMREDAKRDKWYEDHTIPCPECGHESFIMEGTGGGGPRDDEPRWYTGHCRCAQRGRGCDCDYEC